MLISICQSTWRHIPDDLHLYYYYHYYCYCYYNHNRVHTVLCAINTLSYEINIRMIIDEC
jgi:hypothetical protein